MAAAKAALRGLKIRPKKLANNAAIIVILKASMALRTVWSLQPRNSAIRGALSPRALDRMIWLRLTVNRLDDRNSFVSLWHSSSVKSRTKIGFLIPSTIPLTRLSLSGSH